MKPIKNTNGSRIAEIIQSRSPAGIQDSVKGWHNMLKKILSRMAPYLQEGKMVTFQKLGEPEKVFFEKLYHQVTVPPSVNAIFIPPSVLFQMLYHRPESQLQPVPDHPRDTPPDDGIVLASRSTDFDVVVNALFAKPPFTPAVDVYDDGRLLAGYVYNNIDECVSALDGIMQTYLQTNKG
jgi:hypothetical protein